jgi:hypothetical protein
VALFGWGNIYYPIEYNDTHTGTCLT